jgi:hypothetical protein
MVQADYGSVIDAKKCINSLLAVRLSMHIRRACGGTRRERVRCDGASRLWFRNRRKKMHKWFT